MEKSYLRAYLTQEKATEFAEAIEPLNPSIPKENTLLFVPVP